jgi:hypothetical protein
MTPIRVVKVPADHVLEVQWDFPGGQSHVERYRVPPAATRAARATPLTAEEDSPLPFDPPTVL